jgi:signal peptidase I
MAKRKPWIAAALSLVTPGLGHLYVGRVRRAVSFFVLIWLVGLLAIVLLLVLPPSAILLAAIALACVGVVVWITADAWQSAMAVGDHYTLRSYNRWYIYVIIVFAVGFLFQPIFQSIVEANLAKAYVVPSASMEPTILPGDFLVVSKLPGARRDLTRGDLAVFRSVDAAKRMQVKRIVGLPSDTIRMQDGVLFVNGQAVPEPYVQRPDLHNDYYDPAFDWQRQYVTGLDLPASYHPTRDTWGPLVVPDGHYFILGDNRDHASDSRYWGFLPHKNVQGRPAIIYYSYDREATSLLPWLTAVRWGRVGDEPT